MNVADQVRRAKEDFDAVYAEGVEEGKALGGYTEGEKAGFDAGKQAEYDAFWDEFQDNGKRVSYIACFGGGHWNNGLLNPKYPLNIEYANYAFYQNSIGGDLVKYFEDIGKVLNIEGAKPRGLNNTFDSSHFTRVGKIHSTGASWYGTFNGCTKLVTIDEAGNPAENGNTQFQSTTFTGCTALKNITIVGWIVNSTSFSSSTKLEAASIESIINHLSDTSSGKTLTLSLTAVDNAYGWYLPDGSFAGGSTSGYWGSLEASKPNWTINLV